MTNAQPPKKLPQHKNDIAITMNIAIGPRKFLFTPMLNDDRITDKLKKVLLRVASRSKCNLYIGTTFATMRRESDSGKDAPRWKFNSPRDLATQLLEEFQNNGGEL